MSFRTLLAASRPHVAVGIAPDRVSAVVMPRASGQPAVTAHASEPLPAQAIDPVLTGPNLADRAAVVAALRRVFERIGQRPRRVVLAVPDTIAKVSLLRFEKVPARPDDLDQLIRWQLRKAAPFNLDEGVVSYSRGASLDGGGREYVVVLARRDVVREYESACEELGAHAGVVDLATLGVISAVSNGSAGAADDWLLVHVTAAYATVAILRGGELIFYRNRGEETEGDLTALVHQTAMYYEDRLGGQRFSRVVLVSEGTPPGVTESGESLRRHLEQRLGSNVVVGRPDTVRYPDRVEPAVVDRYLPLIGLLQR